MSKIVSSQVGPLVDQPQGLVSHAAAAMLRSASIGLSRLARRVRSRGRLRRSDATPELEFYAEAGAPEGALYVDGVLVGKLPGVTRL